MGKKKQKKKKEQQEEFCLSVMACLSNLKSVLFLTKDSNYT